MLNYSWLPSCLLSFRTVIPKEVALDGKWDLGVGLWFESTLMQSHTNNVMIRRWETYFNFGMDYTLPLGNGLNLTAEYFRYDRTDDLTQKGQTYHLYGSSAIIR